MFPFYTHTLTSMSDVGAGLFHQSDEKPARRLFTTNTRAHSHRFKKALFSPSAAAGWIHFCARISICAWSCSYWFCCSNKNTLRAFFIGWSHYRTVVSSGISQVLIFIAADNSSRSLLQLIKFGHVGSVFIYSVHFIRLRDVNFLEKNYHPWHKLVKIWYIKDKIIILYHSCMEFNKIYKITVFN